MYLLDLVQHRITLEKEILIFWTGLDVLVMEHKDYGISFLISEKCGDFDFPGDYRECLFYVKEVQK